MSGRSTRPTRTERLNTALYKKMFSEQENYRAWLLRQTPEEILNHTFEYTSREDILMSLEYNDLEPAQARALLALRDPLATVYHEYSNAETNHMTDIWELFSACAQREAKKQREQQAER